jgi:hypothetical protein
MVKGKCFRYELTGAAYEADRSHHDRSCDRDVFCANRPPIFEKVAKTYGLDSWDKVEAIRYTWNRRTIAS